MPLINFNPSNYLDLIDLVDETEYMPPILTNFDFSGGDATTYARKKLCEHNLGFDLMSLPCHTQSVERCVKVVTEASMAICGKERRNGYLINTLQSRNNMLIFRTKSDFNVNIQSLPAKA